MLRALGPFDAQIVQFSGAIWYPIAYDFPPELKDRLARDKRVNQMARARQYIEWVDAAHVLPCAGPPAFLDDDLFALNDVDRDPANIFPDQAVFLELLRDSGIDRGALVVPGSVVDLEAGECKVTHPADDDDDHPAVHRQARVPRRVPAGLGAVARARTRVVVARTARPRARARGLVRAVVAPGADHVGRDRGQRRARRR